MSYVMMLWSMIAAAALVLAVLHALVWSLDRRAYANLAFVVVAVALIGVAWAELGMMHAATPDEWARWIRWFQVPAFFLICGLVVFVRLYLGTGRSWLLWTIIAIRTAMIVINFTVDSSFNFDEVRAIHQIRFLGEQVSVVSDAVTAPRQVFATASTFLCTLFIIDASISLWRRGTREARRRALVVGGSVACFAMVAILSSQLVVWGVLTLPTLIAPSFLITLAAMAFEMSRDTLRATRLARELRESEQSLELAASAAGLGLWSWDSERQKIWATERARRMFGSSNVSSAIELEQLLPLVSPDDCERIGETLQAAAANSTEQEIQFQVHTEFEGTRWLLARGRWELGASGRRTMIRGVLRDVTDQHRTQEELDELRRELAHAGRVTALGELAFSLAHELRQPLAAILNNVQVAQMMVQSSDPNMNELREILVDIHRDDRRAADVIDRLRAMMSRRPPAMEPIAIGALLQDVVSLVRADAVRRGVHLETRIGPDALIVHGDRVHMSQVLINLIMNAMDAMADTPAPRKRVVLSARAAENHSIEIAVMDYGTGIAPEMTTKVFEPLFTTKTSGMGIGLAVSRTIIEAHGGRLWAESNTEGGATFRVALPAMRATVLATRGAQ